jgi:hypothetical protein
MRTAITSLVLFVMSLLAGCGARFGPASSMNNKTLFSDKPHITVHTNTASYALRWQYGPWGFFFQPRVKIVHGQLLFSLQGSSSSGNLSGQYSEIPITDPKQIQVLQAGGGFWFEPDGRKLPLEFKKL